MRVARVVERLPPELGGKEVHAAELTAALARRGVEQHVFYSRGTPPPATRSTRKEASLGGFCRWLPGAIERAHRRAPFDLVHAHGDFPEALATSLVCRRLGIPAVLTVHGGLSRSRRHDIARVTTMSAMQQVLAVSPGVAADLIRIGVSAEISVRPSGVRDEFFATNGAHRAGDRVITVGRLAPVKGLEHLLEAYDYLQARRPLRWTVFATGKGSYADAIRGEISRRPGMTLREEPRAGRLAESLAGASVFVLTSVDLQGQREGTPTAVLEALAVGTPVVASAASGAAAMAGEGVPLEVISESGGRAVAEAIERALEDKQRHGHGEPAIRPQAWDEVADEVHSHYRRSLNRARRPAALFAVPWLEVGGAEKFMLTTARAAAHGGARTLVAGADGALSAEVKAPLELVRLNFLRGAWANLWNVAAFTGAALRARPRSVNTHHLLTALTAKAGCGLAGVKARQVLTFHGTEKDWQERVIGLLAPLFCDRVLTVSDALEDRLRRYALPTRRSRIGVAHAGIDEPLKRRTESQAVGVVARLVGRKGHRVLLEAWASVERTGWRLELWGDGPERGSLERQAARLGLDDVVFCGSVPDAADRVGQFPIVVLPALREGLPLSIVEAMAARCAVVASDLPGVREIAGDAEAIRLVPAGDPRALGRAIQELLVDERLRSELAEAGYRRWRSSFSQEAMLSVYQRELGIPLPLARPARG